MKKQTISAQIAALRTAIEASDFDAAANAAEALANRKTNAAQAAEIEALREAMEAIRPGYTMSGHLRRYRSRYQVAITATGNKSLNNGDDMATFLEGKTPEEVCALADEFTPIKGGQRHIEKYARLNPGQKRMNAGNKLRSAAKNGKLEITDAGIQAV